ncbi:MAG TPA: mannosyltransferase family protein [Acidimicrobiales bacterium]|nr:mannosyltransferase family protein [Acidimicrobiales bacterium]
MTETRASDAEDEAPEPSPAEGPDAPEKTLPRARPWAWIWRPLGIFAASRVVTVVAAVVAATIAEELGDDLSTDKPWPPPSPTRYLTLRALGSWDGGWYARIAEQGYPQDTGDPEPWADFAFFPLFPAAVRVVSRVLGVTTTVAGITLSILLGAVAVSLLWLLARDLGGTAMADRAVALFSFFPGSIVLSMAYAESMMLTFALACLLALFARRWELAGLAAGLATATRPNAIALCFCCAWAAALAVRRRREWRALAAPALSVTGIMAYFLFLQRRTGELFFWFDVQSRTWNEKVDFGVGTWHRLQNALADPLDVHQPRDINSLVATLGLLFVVFALYALWRWRPPAVLTIYAVVVILLAVMSQTLGLRPRFVLTAFPLLLALASWLRGVAFHVFLGWSAGLLGVFMIISVATLYATP